MRALDEPSSIDKSLRLTSIVLLLLLVGNYLASHGEVFHKWIPFLVVGSSISLFPWLQKLLDEDCRKFKILFFILDFLLPCLLLIFIYSSYRLHFNVLRGVGLLFMTCAIFTISVFAVAMANVNGVSKKCKLFLQATLLGLGSWCALLDVPNWINWNLSIQRDTPYALMVSIAILIFLIESIFDSSAEKNTLSPWRVFVYFSIILGAFGYLSFRYDSLFLGSSEYHWEYFVGPIRGLRDGGWLLWDIPSQYGFLNILIASLLPFKTSWQALYVFQGCLLFLVSTLYYLTLNRCVSRKIFFNFLIVLVTLFLADPAFIGPQLYPSSSVFRFLWCYLIFFMIIYFVNNQIKPTLFLGVVMIMWIFGCLWSFESAIYSSAISLLSVVAYLFSPCMSTKEDFLKRMVKLVGIIAAAAGLLSLILVSLTIYYQFRIGEYPDFRMFYEYALSYGGGFGEIPIAKFGVIWIYVLIFSLVFGSIFFVRSDLDSYRYDCMVILASLGLVLSLSTYLIGRAHASNVTAVLPLICLILITCFKLNSVNSLRNIPLYVIGFPIIFISFSGGLVQPTSVDTLLRMNAFSSDIASRLRRPETNLSTLIEEAKITPDDYVAYYGFNAAMPIDIDDEVLRTYEKTWILNPFQLLEEPISAERREVIAKRSISARLKNEGFLIQAKGQFEDRFKEWEGIIARFYWVDQKFENKDYIIFHLIKK